MYTALSLVAIQELNEEKEVLKVTEIMFTYWIDEMFSWNPDEYNGITSLTVAASNIIMDPDFSFDQQRGNGGKFVQRLAYCQY